MKALILFLMGSLAIWAQWTPPPPVRGTLAQEEESVETKAADPVLVEGKKVSEMDEEETREFLQEKIRTITQADGEVEMLKVAPGYPLSLSFAELPTHVVMGDPKMLGYQKMGKTLVLSATAREGDTSLQVFFTGGKLRVYHVFIEPHFGTGETAVRVAPFIKTNVSWNPSTQENGGNSFKEILNIVRNYDLMLQNKLIEKRDVKRMDLFREGRYPGFVYFCLYRFASGPVVVTFSYKNSYAKALRIDESKFRVELGHQLFIPDYVTLHRNFLMPGEKTTGMIVLKQSPFHADQPFELVCR